MTPRIKVLIVATAAVAVFAILIAPAAAQSPPSNAATVDCPECVASLDADETAALIDKIDNLIDAAVALKDALETPPAPEPLKAINPAADEIAVGGFWNRKREKSFLKKFCEILDSPECDLSKREKRQVKLAMIFSKKARDEAKSLMQESYDLADTELKLRSAGTSERGPPSGVDEIPVGTPVEFGNIDWSNFNWEGARDFWVAVIKAIADIIKVLI